MSCPGAGPVSENHDQRRLRLRALAAVPLLLAGMSAGLLAAGGSIERAVGRPALSCSQSVTVAAANIRFTPLMAQWQVRADVRRMARSPRTRAASAYLGAEIHSFGYKAAWRAALPSYRHPGLRTENPISMAPGWRVVSVGIRHMMDGIPDIAPDLYTTVARTLSPAGLRVAFVATHMVSRAWTHREASTALRRARWRAHHLSTAAIVRSQHRAGRTVIVGGDLNRPTPVRWAPRQQMLANAGLMQLAVVPAAGVRVAVHRLRPVPTSQLFTDHPIVAARVGLAGRCASRRRRGPSGVPRRSVGRVGLEPTTQGL